MVRNVYLGWGLFATRYECSQAIYKDDQLFLGGLQDGIADKTSAQARLKLTIPREPDLVTAHRAERTRFVISLNNKYIIRFVPCRLLGA